MDEDDYNQIMDDPNANREELKELVRTLKAKVAALETDLKCAWVTCRAVDKARVMFVARNAELAEQLSEALAKFQNALQIERDLHARVAELMEANNEMA